MSAAAAVVAALAVASACSTGGEGGTAGAAPASTTAAPTSPADPDPLPAATAAEPAGVDDEPVGGVNATALEARHGRAVAMVIARPCDGIGYSQGTGFAVDARTLVTNWHVVAERPVDADAVPVDPHPWILTYNRGWRRGTVVGASESPDVAVIRLDEGEPDMADWLDWAQDGPEDGEHLAILGYPGIEQGEFNISVGRAEEVDGTSAGIPSFTVRRDLSGRTGPGNSGGPIVTSDGDVVGMHTWGRFDRSTWYGQDHTVVRDQVRRLLVADRPLPTACPADGPDRLPLAYTVRLGTFSDPAAAAERSEQLRDAGPPGAVITSVGSDDWVPFLLSDYPSVVMAGPFATSEAAREAVATYQAALDAAGGDDRFSVGVMPARVFDGADTRPCLPATGRYVVVHGVTEADPLKLRAGPTTAAAVVAELDSGTELMVGDDPPVDANGLRWLHVSTLSDGEDRVCGWVAERYTESLGDG